MRVYLVNLREFGIQRSCVHFPVRLLLNFSRHLSGNTRKCMSSSDSVSLSTSSSESIGRRGVEVGKLMKRVPVLEVW